MKTLLTVLLLSIVLSATAQKWVRPVTIISYHIGTVAIGAIGDAVYDEGNKSLAHGLKAMEVGMLIGGPFLFDIKRSEALSYILSYGFIRLSLFDAMYNGTRGLPILYNGTTSSYDKFMRQIPPDGRAFIKSCSLIVGFSIPLKEL